MTISYKVLGSSIRGKVLWQTACLAFIWVVWRERCVKIFQDKVRTLEALLDVIHFFASFCASCTTTFKGISLNVFQLDWFLVCSLKGVSQQGVISWEEIIHFQALICFCIFPCGTLLLYRFIQYFGVANIPFVQFFVFWRIPLPSFVLLDA